MTVILRRRTLARLLLIFVACIGGAGAARAQDTARTARIDFQDADLRAVITAIAEAGALNVTYGEMPNRRVTLHLRQPVARADMLPLLRSVAASIGLRVVEDGALLRVEAVDARGAVPGAAGGTQQAREGVRLFVYRLRHARATKLAATLQTIYGNRVATETGPTNYGMTGRTLTEQLRGTQVPPLIIDTIGRGAVGAAAVLQGSVQGEIQVVPDETTNSLLIRAQAADYETIRQAVEVLDLRPMQVFIEVLIAEVRRTRGLDLGVEANATRTGNGNTTTVGLDTPGPEGVLVQLSRGGKVSVDVALTALATRGNVRILSRPLIMAQNNVEAHILVGSQRPFVQVFRSLPTDNASRDQVVQYRDVGTQLTVRPTISADGYVTLEVTQEVNQATSETQFDAPVISTREVKTQLLVRDSQTVVLGGLTDTQREANQGGIPVLSEIPLLGGLFGRASRRASDTELFLFLTPRIIRSDDEASDVTQPLRERARKAEP